MTKFREKEYIEILKSLGGTEAHLTKTAEILKIIKDETEEKRKEEGENSDPVSARTINRALKKLLGDSDDEIDKLLDKEGVGHKDRDTYILGFKKKNKKITGYWYEKKVGEGDSKELVKFLVDAVTYSKVINPEFKPDYYSCLQEIFGAGIIRENDEFRKSIIDMKPYSYDDEIDVMGNVLAIQKAIDSQKKIQFKLGVYQYVEGTIQLRISDKKREVSPYQIMMSNERYYLMAGGRLQRKKKQDNFLFYRIDLMDKIKILDERIDNSSCQEWKNPAKFMTANPYFFSGKRENIIIGFEENQITQVVDWFGTEENGLYKIKKEYQYTDAKNESVKMLELEFSEVNVMAFSFWVMQYMDCIEVIEGNLLKQILKERMNSAMKYRIRNDEREDTK